MWYWPLYSYLIIVLSASLTFLGVHLGVDLYLAGIFVFTCETFKIRVKFKGHSWIRDFFLKKMEKIYIIRGNCGINAE
ncbi:DUF1290 domain-containing protein [Peribacillus sp. NPDC097206]